MFRTPLAISTRGGRIDALHYGSVAVTDAASHVLYHANNPHYPTYLRSSIKMIQALPVVMSGAAERFGFTAAEIAICCASHTGAPYHIATVSSILNKIGLDGESLRCGAHDPEDREERRHVMCELGAPLQLHNNCSGKHAGMLAVCQTEGWPVENYFEIGHPLQKWIHRLMSDYSNIPQEQIGVGIDGCSLPAFYMPISGGATILARFIERSLDVASPDAVIFNAICDRPEMINTYGGFDTELVRLGNRLIIAKRGAMAMFLIGAMSPEHGPIGIGLKLEDGHMGPMPVVVMKVLESLGLIDDVAIAELDRFRAIHLRNWRGIDIGEVTANFQLYEGGIPAEVAN